MAEERQWKKVKPVVLIVLDGFGVTLYRKGNAVLNAQIPTLDRFWGEYPHTLLNASGESVGLPWGEFGNSEVGHITMGIGSVIKQSLAMIKESIISGSFYENEKMLWAINEAKSRGKRLHIAGIFSPAGVHGHIDYMVAMLKICKNVGFNRVFLHLFTDGRDTTAQSVMQFYPILQKAIEENGCGQIASVAGRFYAMDRISRWDRTELAYKAMLGTGAETASSLEELVLNSYNKGVFDEMIVPTAIVNSQGHPVGAVREGDSIIFTNHRRDRIRQIASFFASDEVAIKEARKTDKLTDMKMVSMVFYELINQGIKVAFTPEEINRSSGELLCLPQVISDLSLKQFHLAETEKFPHVTYFFSGGGDVTFDGETRVHIPSPKVRGYEEKPEMSLYQVKDELKKAINSGEYGFIVVNFANPDMVGHSGVYEAAMKAVEIVDGCLAEIYEEVKKAGGTILITSDHGNCEEMINPVSGNVSKEHSSNPVPLMLIDEHFRVKRNQELRFADAGYITPSGILADVTPTVLDLLGTKTPEVMTGISLMDSMQ